MHSCTRWITCFAAPPPLGAARFEGAEEGGDVDAEEEEEEEEEAIDRARRAAEEAADKAAEANALGNDRWAYILLQSVTLALTMDIMQVRQISRLFAIDIFFCLFLLLIYSFHLTSCSTKRFGASRSC
jgi:hypothetical protein